MADVIENPWILICFDERTTSVRVSMVRTRRGELGIVRAVEARETESFRFCVDVDAKLICKHKGLIPDSNVKACQPI